MQLERLKAYRSFFQHSGDEWDAYILRDGINEGRSDRANMESMRSRRKRAAKNVYWFCRARCGKFVVDDRSVV